MRRVPGLRTPPEYSDLEVFLEWQERQAEHVLVVARWLAPLVITVVGVSASVLLGVLVNLAFLYGLIPTALLAVASGLWFHRLAKQVLPTRMALKKMARKVMAKVIGWKNVLGLEPALAPKVGKTLDEAAGLYLRVCPAPGGAVFANEPPGPWAEARERAVLAMEAAMARILELAEPEGARAQDIAYDAGWVEPLLDEMREMAEAMSRQEEKFRVMSADVSPYRALAGLREARAEFADIETAVEELEQRRRG